MEDGTQQEFIAERGETARPDSEMKPAVPESSKYLSIDVTEKLQEMMKELGNDFKKEIEFHNTGKLAAGIQNSQGSQESNDAPKP